MPAHAQQPHHLSCCRALTRTALPWSVSRGVGGWGGGVGGGGMITFMFLCTHRHSNLISFLAVEQRQAQLFHDQLPVGWGELIRFMFLCIQTHSNLIIFLAVEHLHALLFHDGWDDNVHVPMHTQAQQPHHLSSRRAETGTALSWSVTGGVGWVNKVHVPMPAHAQQPHHLSCCRALTRTALSWSVVELDVRRATTPLGFICSWTWCRGRATQSTCKHTSATFIRKFTGKIPMPLQSHTNDIKNNTRKSATLYANLQVKARRQEKSGTSNVKKATRENTILYGNLQEKCRYQQKSGTSDTKKSGTSDAKKSGTSERLTPKWGSSSMWNWLSYEKPPKNRKGSIYRL